MKKRFTITVQMMIAMAIGVLCGLVLGPKAAPIKIIGDIFLRLIQMSIVLLIMGQIIEAVGSLNPREIGKLGAKTVAIFFISSLSAAVFGIVMGVFFKPGAGFDISSASLAEMSPVAMTSLSDTLRDFFPSNVISAMASGNIVQVIVFSLVFGIALGFVSSEKSCGLLNLIHEFNDVILKMVTIVMKVAPIGIFALICNTVGQMGASVILPLVKYLWVYALGTLIFLLLWFTVTAVYCKLNFFSVVKKMVQMSVLAMATTSSAVTLPTALKDSQEKLGIGERVANLVVPLGMSLNSNGSAMHMAITVITIAQIYGTAEYTFAQYVYIAVMATLLSLANAVAPGADIVSLAMIVPQLGLPIESIAIFAGVGYFVGALRTILNVDSDVFTALLVAKSENDINYDIFLNKQHVTQRQ